MKKKMKKSGGEMKKMAVVLELPDPAGGMTPWEYRMAAQQLLTQYVLKQSELSCNKTIDKRIKAVAAEQVEAASSSKKKRKKKKEKKVVEAELRADVYEKIEEMLTSEVKAAVGKSYRKLTKKITLPDSEHSVSLKKPPETGVGAGSSDDLDHEEEEEGELIDLEMGVASEKEADGRTAKQKRADEKKERKQQKQQDKQDKKKSKGAKQARAEKDFDDSTDDEFENPLAGSPSSPKSPRVSIHGTAPTFDMEPATATASSSPQAATKKDKKRWGQKKNKKQKDDVDGREGEFDNPLSGRPVSPVSPMADGGGGGGVDTFDMEDAAAVSPKAAASKKKEKQGKKLKVSSDGGMEEEFDNPLSGGGSHSPRSPLQVGGSAATFDLEDASPKAGKKKKTKKLKKLKRNNDQDTTRGKKSAQWHSFKRLPLRCALGSQPLNCSEIRGLSTVQTTDSVVAVLCRCV
eukprot:COSAG06_NODE_605_length_13878_cov_13.424995_2_plen_461_part_00